MTCSSARFQKYQIIFLGKSGMNKSKFFELKPKLLKRKVEKFM